MNTQNPTSIPTSYFATGGWKHAEKEYGARFEYEGDQVVYKGTLPEYGEALPLFKGDLSCSPNPMPNRVSRAKWIQAPIRDRHRLTQITCNSGKFMIFIPADKNPGDNNLGRAWSALQTPYQEGSLGYSIQCSTAGNKTFNYRGNEGRITVHVEDSFKLEEITEISYKIFTLLREVWSDYHYRLEYVTDRTTKAQSKNKPEWELGSLYVVDYHYFNHAPNYLIYRNRLQPNLLVAANERFSLLDGKEQKFIFAEDQDFPETDIKDCCTGIESITTPTWELDPGFVEDSSESDQQSGVFQDPEGFLPQGLMENVPQYQPHQDADVDQSFYLAPGVFGWNPQMVPHPYPWGYQYLYAQQVAYSSPQLAEGVVVQNTSTIDREMLAEIVEQAVKKQFDELKVSQQQNKLEIQQIANTVLSKTEEMLQVAQAPRSALKKKTVFSIPDEASEPESSKQTKVMETSTTQVPQITIAKRGEPLPEPARVKQELTWQQQKQSSNRRTKYVPLERSFVEQPEGKGKYVRSGVSFAQAAKSQKS